MKRIAIYGGSFNPPTNGHLLNTAELLNLGKTDEVWWMPSPCRLDKPDLIEAMHRLIMCHLAVNTFFGSRVPIFVKDIEIFDQEFIGTYGLLKKCQQAAGTGTEILFVVGADIVKDIPNWKNAEQLLKEFYFLVLPRIGYKIPDNLPADRFLLVEKKKGMNIIQTSFSSSEIRKRMRNGLSAEGLVPGAVMNYIIRNDLPQLWKQVNTEI